MNILITGSVAYDYLMTFPGHFRDHILSDHLESISLSFLVDSMVRVRGGIAPNIAYTLSLLGQTSRLWATVGEDFLEYRLWLEEHGIDTSGLKVIPGVFTASFFANTDRSNHQISSFYPGAMAYADQHSLCDLQGEKPDLVVISANDPAAMRKLAAECKQLGYPYIYDASQQVVRLSAEELQEGISGALALFVNEYEYALIQKMTGYSLAEMLRRAKFLVVTRGEQGASIYMGADEIRIPTVKPLEILDPTGVGDAFRGGFLAGYAKGLDFEICGRMGALAATYCLEQRGTQNHSFSPAEFVARFRENFGDRGELGTLFCKEVS